MCVDSTLGLGLCSSALRSKLIVATGLGVEDADSTGVCKGRSILFWTSFSSPCPSPTAPWTAEYSQACLAVLLPPRRAALAGGRHALTTAPPQKQGHASLPTRQSVASGRMTSSRRTKLDPGRSSAVRATAGMMVSAMSAINTCYGSARSYRIHPRARTGSYTVVPTMTMRCRLSLCHAKGCDHGYIRLSWCWSRMPENDGLLTPQTSTPSTLPRPLSLQQRILVSYKIHAGLLKKRLDNCRRILSRCLWLQALGGCQDIPSISCHFVTQPSYLTPDVTRRAKGDG